MYHVLNLTEPAKSVRVAVFPSNNETLHIYISLDEQPTPTNFYVDKVVPNNLTSDMEDADNYTVYMLEHSIFIPSGNLTNVTRLHAAVKREGNKIIMMIIIC